MTCLREANSEPIPGYRLIEPLGSGGFGEVWKCEAPGGLHKAIKFVFGSLNSLDVDGARAEQEFKALDRIKDVRHPFVLSTERIEVIEGEVVIVMELADRNLHDAFLEAQSSGLIGIPRDDLLRFMRDAAEALDYMTEKHGLAHLDIKPRNLFLVSDRVKVADFGLVKHLERSGASGVLGGVTPLYAAPETYSNHISDKSDQYSLAIVYQELLTSQRPFNGKNVRMLAQQHLNEQPELRSLPEAERPIVARALSKDPAQRFPSCMAFVRALYNARSAPREEPGTAKGKRPKSISDTMEDMFLDQMPDEPGLAQKPKQRKAPPGLEAVDASEEMLAALENVSELGLTAALPQTGTLRPTIVVGLGSLGRRALMELRCRFLDRFGSVSKLPVIRFLYVDSDRDALIQAQRGAAELTLQGSEVLHLPLQPMAHYRRRQLDQLSDWLPREKLFAMPRNLQTQGSRALGRLAFADNYLRVVSRLKRELAAVVHPDALYQSVSNTGLALRDQTIRVVVVGSATGGASGYLVDLAYAMRRLLRQQGQSAARINAFLMCGAPDDPATPALEQSNLYATLTEINHYSEGVAAFTAQYGADEPRQVEQGAPYDAVYVLPQRERTPEARHDVIAHLGQYLFQDLITPLGAKLEHERSSKPPQAWDGPATAFRTLGTHAVWFPRGLLLRLAARLSLGNLVGQWTDEEQNNDVGFGPRYAGLGGNLAVVGNNRGMKEVDAAFSRVLAEPGLQPATLTLRMEEMAAKFLDGMGPTAALAQLLQGVEEQCWQYGGPDNPGSWATQALARVRDWLGSGVQGGNGQLTVTVGLAQRKSRLNKALENACSQLGEEWDRKLHEVANSLMELPGPRLASAEGLLQRLVQHFAQTAQEQGARIKEQAARAEEARLKMQEGLEACSSGGGFRWLTWRPQRPLRVFLDLLAAFARQCLAEDSLAILQVFYHSVTARLRDRLRDVALLRQRLRHVSEMLTSPPGMDTEEWKEEDPIAASLPAVAEDRSSTPMTSLTTFWEVSRTSGTTKVVLPVGATELESAAAKFVATLTPEHWLCLDQSLQEEVLKPRGGLNQAAFTAGDLQRLLIGPLLDRAAACLSQYLPVTDVAQVEMAALDEQEQRVRSSLESAAPLACSLRSPSKLIKKASEDKPAEDTEEAAFLLVPASDAGKAYGEEVRKVLPHVQAVKVPGQADLMFCRERGRLTPEDLERLLAPCREMYQQAASVPAASPHCRFDTRDWVPLES